MRTGRGQESKCFHERCSGRACRAERALLSHLSGLGREWKASYEDDKIIAAPLEAPVLIPVHTLRLQASRHRRMPPSVCLQSSEASSSTASLALLFQSPLSLEQWKCYVQVYMPIEILAVTHIRKSDAPGDPPPRTSEGRSNVFQGVHPHVKREEKFSLEQYVFTPTP